MVNASGSKPADEALFWAIREQANASSMEIAMDKIVAALDAGGDPHAAVEDGHSIMEELCGARNSAARYNSDARGILLCFLMNRGGNPLAWPEAFAKMPERSLAVTHDVLEGLVAREEAGFGYRTHDGGNALHCFASHPPAWEDLRGWLMGKPRKARRVHPAWIAQHDHAGKTPLHHLMEAPGDKCSSGQRISRWGIFEHLLGMEEGPDLLSRDRNGVSVVDLIVQAASEPGVGGRHAWEEMPALRQAIARWRAVAEQAQLEQDTAAARAAGRGWRL